MNDHSHLQPIQARQRFQILDLLRGIALIGICLANFPEFSLYTFQPTAVTDAMPSAGIDRFVRWLQLIFIDGKFYTIFSILFGIGFSIIINNVERRGGSGFRVFYRRMLGLAAIGFLHLMLLWSGDILLLYAVAGMLLPLFRRASGRALLCWAAAFTLSPIVIEWICSLTGYEPERWAYNRWWEQCAVYGITEENFGTWLRDADSYTAVSQFLMQGAYERLWEFVGGHRLPKVLGLFIFGFWIGRNRLYARIAESMQGLRHTAMAGIGMGLPLSVVYAADAMAGHPFGDVVSAAVYAVSVVPLGIGYMAVIAIIHLRCSTIAIWRWLAAPGRMALTNYIMQSVFGILIYYGIGFGLATSMGLAATEAVALAVVAAEIILSRLWMHYFAYGPLEWIWRMTTYGHTFSIRR